MKLFKINVKVIYDSNGFFILFIGLVFQTAVNKNKQTGEHSPGFVKTD